MNRDPLGEEGGINLYGFVENDPVNNVDPEGLQTDPGKARTKSECISICWWILDLPPDLCRPADRQWEFQKCVNRCMGHP
jgi:uncharacterized protein RhaS with RHS repeats